MISKTYFFLLIFFCVFSVNAQNLFVNADFENGDLTGWNTWNNGITKDAALVYKGTTSGVLNAGSQASLQQWIGLESNTKYIFSVWGKVSKAGESATFLVSDHGKPQQYVLVNSTEYKEFVLTFETGTVTGNVTLSLYKSEASYGKIYCDNFQLYKASNEVTEIQLSGENQCPNVIVGQQYQINATILPSSAIDKSLTWSIAEGEVHAAVDQLGKLTAISQGTVKIKAVANDVSGTIAYFDVRIVDGPVLVASISVSHDNPENVLYAGEKLQMVAGFLPQYFCDQSVTWKVENQSGKASISTSGILKAEGEGDVDVIAVSKADNTVSGKITMNIQLPQRHTYYVDATAGNDTNDGLSKTSAWKSLSKVNGISFIPGDSILFKAGEVWTGQLKIESDGVLGHPVVFSRYGNGNKPRIDGKGVESYTLLLKNANYAEASEFDITNKGTVAKGGRFGVLLLAQNEGSVYQTVIKNLDIHDVNGEKVKAKGGGGGIVWSMEGEITSRFVDALIQGNHIYDCARNGIGGNSSYGGYQGIKEYYSPGMKIRQNLIERIPGDGIVPIGCDGAIVEYNICRDFTNDLPDGDAAAGIWPWNSLNTIIQHNEVSGHMAGWDGQGFDSDYNCSGTIIQYNYSHDNCGGFILICSTSQWGGYNNNSIIRYNISINDGFRTWGTGKNFSPAIHIAGNVYNTQIYNNTIYVGPKPASVKREFINASNWDGWADKTYIYNNIFYGVASTYFSMNQSKNNTFSHNVYYGSSGFFGDAKPFSGDPLFVKPGKSDDVNNYKLQAGSKALKSGKLIANNGGKDFFGNLVSDTSLPNIGAYNGEAYSVGLGQQDLIKEDLFSVFPNPITDSVISLSIIRDLKDATIQVQSLTGNLVYSVNYSTLKMGRIPLDFMNYRSGVYLVSIESENEKQTQKIIKR